VQAYPGERYVWTVDLLGEGAPLHCDVVAGDPVDEVAAAINELDPAIEVHWLVRTPEHGGELPLDAILAEDPDLVVNWAIEIADGVANVELVHSEDLTLPPDPTC